MKRLQFRHHDNIFETRELALSFFENITNTSHTASTVFGKSLYAEPMVIKYKDNEGNVQIIFALGVDSPNTPYHLIDSKDILEKIIIEQTRAESAETQLQISIDNERDRAESAETQLQMNIDNEHDRAESAETQLQMNIDNERNRAESAETWLHKYIDENIYTNIAEIKKVGPSNSNVREEYALINNDGKTLGEHIKIYKDSSLVDAKVGHGGAVSVNYNKEKGYYLEYEENPDTNVEYLYLIYLKGDGELSFVAIDFESFLMEAEFGDGLQVSGHVASIKIKEGENFLTVDKNGLQTKNIQEAITDSVNIEYARALSAETWLHKYIESAETQLQIDIAKEQTRAESAETWLHKYIESAETQLQTNIDNERNRAESAESKLQKNIDGVKETIDVFLSGASIGVDVIDTLKEIQNYIDNDASGAQIMIHRISANTHAINQCKNDFSNEILESEKKFKEITDNQVETFNTLLQTTISGLSTSVYNAVDTETTRAMNAENVILNIISGLSTSVYNAIDEETKRAKGVEDNLKTDIGVLSGSIYVLSEQIETNNSNVIGSAVTEAKNAAVDVIAKVVSGAPAAFDTLKEIADWISADTTGAAIMADDIKNLRKDINLLNSDDITKFGSVKNTASNVMDDKLLYDTAPIITITPQEAKEQTLLRHILFENSTKYFYVSNNATDMMFVESDGNKVNLNDKISGLTNENQNLSVIISGLTNDLNDKISDLTDENQNLNDKISDLTNEISGLTNEISKLTSANQILNDKISELTDENQNLNDKISGLTQSLTDISEQIKEIYDKLNNVTVSEDEVKKIINDYISGATNEIKVAKNDDNSRLIIGFADDAIFG